MTDVEPGRVALIRFAAPDGTPSVGSGLMVNSRSVLTADHVADGSGHRFDFHGRTYEVTQVLRSGSPEADLAILTMGQPVTGVAPLGCARVNRKLITEVPGCRAVGFPRWKKDGDVRRSAQVNGVIPTAEGLVQTADAGLREGFLTLVGNRQPAGLQIRPGALTDAGTTSPWGGMSGAVVTTAGMIIGVVRSVNLAGDGQSLTVTPITALDHLPDQALARRFWDILGITNPVGLPLTPTSAKPQSDRTSASPGRNTLATASAAFAGGTLLTEFLAHHSGNSKPDDDARDVGRPAAGSEARPAEQENADSIHHGLHHDGPQHEDTHPGDNWPDDSGFQHYGW